MLNQIETNHRRPPLLTLKNGMAGARDHTRLQVAGVLAQKRPDLACTVFLKRSRTGNSDSLLHMAPPEQQPTPVVEAEKTRARKARSRKGAYLRLPSIRNR